MALNAVVPVEGITVISIGTYDPKACREKSDLGRRAAYELQNQIRAIYGRRANIQVNYVHGNVEGITYQLKDLLRATLVSSGTMATPGEPLTPEQITSAAKSFIAEVDKVRPDFLPAPQVNADEEGK